MLCSHRFLNNPPVLGAAVVIIIPKAARVGRFSSVTGPSQSRVWGRGHWQQDVGPFTAQRPLLGL